MHIGTVAKEAGLSVDAIRFYERNSLLRRAPRTEGGFRQYGEDDLETLVFIRRVQGKLAEVRRKLADLRKLEQELRLALHSCDKELRKQDAFCFNYTATTE